MKNTGTFQVTTPTDREILRTRTFDAPRAVVFEAWTKAEHVKNWWDPTGVPLSVCEIDLRPGGTFRWVNSAHGGHVFSGTYREVTAPERLVFSVNMFPSRPEPLTTLLFIEESGKTKLTMRIECGSNEDRDALLQMRIDVGTGRTLDNLAGYLNRSGLALGAGHGRCGCRCSKRRPLGGDVLGCEGGAASRERRAARWSIPRTHPPKCSTSRETCLGR